MKNRRSPIFIKFEHSLARSIAVQNVASKQLRIELESRTMTASSKIVCSESVLNSSKQRDTALRRHSKSKSLESEISPIQFMISQIEFVTSLILLETSLIQFVISQAE